jgi:hypothetical protein
MIQNANRIGNFTSSEIAALMTFGSRPMTDEELAAHKKEFPKSRKKNIESWPGEKAITYIAECNMERRLGRSVSEESTARPLMWGKLNEKRVFEMLGLEYTLCSQETMMHPDFDCWSGSPDGEKFDEGKTVMDIKCPMTLKSFCLLMDPVFKDDGTILYEARTIEAVRYSHPQGEKYYWQLVSNAIITGAKYAELIVYCPYFSELPDIRLYASTVDGDQRGYYWIAGAADDELPYILDGGHYKNLNVIRFEVPESDKTALTDCVKAASQMLIKV